MNAKLATTTSPAIQPARSQFVFAACYGFDPQYFA